MDSAMDSNRNTQMPTNNIYQDLSMLSGLPLQSSPETKRIVEIATKYWTMLLVNEHNFGEKKNRRRRRFKHIWKLNIIKCEIPLLN